ncbi:hypothetical protein MD588_04525 [Photobacterium sp. SDRW27]|uniref:hypothetical protein n=1 Tax=Photobacterium obscurum TaxID=2829490 RepID=UPI002243619B|nr:hypothetical protein [Photobacterium obscurum]MCW8328066.1 hypothetical protein [Photobacterium obscurum]
MILALSASATGCFDHSSSKADTAPYQAGERPHVMFAPRSQQMDLVNDLRFGSRFVRGIDYQTADDGVVSINGRRGLTIADSDGFSTSAQFDVTFSQPLDPGSVSFSGPTQNIFLLPLKPNGNDYFSLERYPGNGSKLIDETKLAQLQFRANVVTLDGEASVLRISPLVPLAPKTKYLVILTNTLRDTEGRSIVAADDYYHLSHPAELAADTALKGVVSRWHDMAGDALVAIAGGFAANGKQSYLSSDRKKAGEQIAHAFTLTTTSGTEQLEALASPKAALINQGMTAQEADAILTSVSSGHEMPHSRKVGIIRRDLTIGDMLDPFLQQLGGIFTALDSESLALQFGMTVEQVDQLKQQYGDFTLSGSLLDTLLYNGFGFDYPSVKFVQGHITLPYFLAAPELDQQGHIDQASLAQFSNDEWKFNAQELAATSNNSKAAFPYPEQQAEYKVPFLVTLPEAQHKPEQGWPVVIFQHGILGDRSNSFPAGMALASLCDKERPENDCFATIAMDLPLHGISPQLLVGSAALPSPFIGFGMDSLRAETNAKLQALDPSLESYQQQKNELDTRLHEMDGIVERHFGATRTPAGHLATMRWQSNDLFGSSGSTFMNFSNVLSQRDRMHQAISDLLNLNASLADIDLDGDGEGDFDTSRVYFVGHSLGGVLGMPFVAVNNDPQVQQHNVNLPKIQAAALLTTGGGVPKLLEHSPGFRPEILGALQHLSTKQSLNLGSKAFEHYFYTLQSVIDGVDPVNFAAKLKAGDTGIYMAEVVGGAPVIDGNGYQQYTAEGEPLFTLPDQTIPNSADGKPVEPQEGSIAAPLAGTEPMIKLMGLQSLKPGAESVNQSFSASAETGEPLKVVARFNRGNHVSPVMALENIQRLLADNQELVAILKSSGISLKHYPLVHLAADSLKRSGGLFLEMTGHVSDFFTHNGMKVAVNDAGLLSRIDPHDGDIPQPLITLAKRAPVTCLLGEECIIDNDDGAFERVGKSWTAVSDRAGDTHGETYAYASDYDDHAAWWFRVDKPGTYRVLMRTPSDFAQGWTTHYATTGARYNVFSSAGESGDKLFNLVKGVNYEAPFDYPLAPNGEYVELGEFVFDDLNRDYKVTLHNRSAEYSMTGPLIADAIKIEYVSANTNMSAAGELQRLVEKAEDIVSSVLVGELPGQYSQQAVDALKVALNEFKLTAANGAMSVTEMQTLKQQLEADLASFKDGMVPDLTCVAPSCVSIDPAGTVMDHRSVNFSEAIAGVLKTSDYGQAGEDYMFYTDSSAVAEWHFEVAQTGLYQVTFNSPGGFGYWHGYGSDKTQYQLLQGEQVFATITADLYNNSYAFSPLSTSQLEAGKQYTVRITGAYSGYGIAADTIKVTYQSE